MSAALHGYGVRRITRQPERDTRHVDGTTFRGTVDRWYVMGDSDDGLYFVCSKDGYASPAEAFAAAAAWLSPNGDNGP